MTGRGLGIVLTSCVLMVAGGAGTICRAQTPGQPVNSVPSAPENPLNSNGNETIGESSSMDTSSTPFSAGGAPPDYDNSLGFQFIRNLASDQATIWTSPSRLRWDDGTWLFPLAGATAAFFATDPASARALIASPHTLNRYREFSDVGVGSLVGIGGGLYIWSKFSRDDHQRETGVLVAEATIDSFGENSALAYTFGRQRPYQGQGQGLFLDGGTSFPSDHAAVAWSAASVIAHEYPGPFTQLLVYGLATAVSASRVSGREHFPSDVLVSSATGWLIGREIYRKHHDPELGGSGLDTLSGNDDGEEHRDRRKMGSPYVPLDSWVYDALDKLAGLGYIHSAMEGLRPWTRIECANLTEAASEVLQNQSGSEVADQLLAHLQQEFSYEMGLLSGGRNLTAGFDSAYARTVSISGPPLTDGDHFGQTISYDFGRPYERGTNLQDGGSFSASAGPLTLYIRAEYQHAPSAPAPSEAVVNFIAARDLVPAPPQIPVAGIDRLRLLDTYVGVNLDNWQITVGKQSLSWGPGPGGSLIWSDNIEPVNMVRIVNPEPIELPLFFRFLGPARFDQFFGRLGDHTYIRRPFIYGQKISFKPIKYLELGFSRTVTIGGQGPGASPLTPSTLLHSGLGQIEPGTGSVPGDAHAAMDWTFDVPGVRHYLVFYGELYADDDFLPIQNPPKNPFRPGIYITRIPGLPKLDLHLEATSTESPAFHNPPNLNYWNFQYRDGYTNDGNLIGNTVGRNGQALQGWLTYWISPRDTFSVTYKNSIVTSAFVPGGGAWQDYAVRNEFYSHSGFYIKSEFQFEHISHFPILFNGPQRNVSGILEVGFAPGKRRAGAQSTHSTD
jgi:membrane-associated phospholipid phosphatase